MHSPNGFEQAALLAERVASAQGQLRVAPAVGPATHAGPTPMDLDAARGAVA